MGAMKGLCAGKILDVGGVITGGGITGGRVGVVTTGGTFGVGAGPGPGPGPGPSHGGGLQPSRG